MEVTFRDLEAYLLQYYGADANEQSLFMKLIEEIGEVAEVLNMRSGRKKQADGDMQMELANELADVIHYAAAIAAVNGIDLGEAILAKDRKASVKYHHDIDLATFIRAKREPENGRLG